MGRTETKAGRRRAGKGRSSGAERRSALVGRKQGSGAGVALVHSIRKTSDELADWLSSHTSEEQAGRSVCAEISREVSRLRELCAKCAATVEGLQPQEAGSGAGDAADRPVRASDFWRQKSIEELAREQGVKPIARLEEVLGLGADLWDSDEDFEEFLQGIYRRRRAEEST